MTCARCKIEYNARHWGECPHCGQNLLPDQRGREESRRGSLEGVVKTSTILISTEDGGIFRSLEEVPERLRRKLALTTASVNSATIVIADQGGRARLASALRNLPDGPTKTGSPSLEEPARAFWRRPSLLWAALVLSVLTGAAAWLLAARYL